VPLVQFHRLVLRAGRVVEELAAARLGRAVGTAVQNEHVRVWRGFPLYVASVVVVSIKEDSSHKTRRRVRCRSLRREYSGSCGDYRVRCHASQGHSMSR